MNTNTKYPRRNEVFQFKELSQIVLSDSPHLCFFLKVNGQRVRCVIQTSHVTDAQLLAVPGFADSLWRYCYTTNEQIPIFQYMDPMIPITNIVDVEPSTDDFDNELRLQCWVTPKGFYQEQYVPFDKSTAPQHEYDATELAQHEEHLQQHREVDDEEAELVNEDPLFYL